MKLMGKKKLVPFLFAAAFLMGGVGNSFAGQTIVVLERGGSQITILPSAETAEYDLKTGELVAPAEAVNLDDLGRDLARAARSLRKEARVKALCELEDLTNPSRSRRCRHDSQ